MAVIAQISGKDLKVTYNLVLNPCLYYCSHCHCFLFLILQFLLLLLPVTHANQR